MILSAVNKMLFKTLMIALLAFSLTGCGVSQRIFGVFIPSERPADPVFAPKTTAEVKKNHQFSSFRYTIKPERLHDSTVSKIRQWASKKINKTGVAVSSSAPEKVQVAKAKPATTIDKEVRSQAQRSFCNKVGSRLSSVSLDECLGPIYKPTGAYSVKGSPIMISKFGKISGVKPTGKVLLLGGTHGDELSSASIVFEWANFLRAEHSGEFIWHVVPVVNPDGLLTNNTTRTNANGIDLNRNMPTPNWQGSALKYWRERAGKSPRKFPGFRAGSEPETQWLVREIAAFKPDMIISVHAPHNMIDYDAPSRTNAPRKLGNIKGGLLGTYPGSLGNYAGERRGIPVVTIELPDANKAMAKNELSAMWGDLIAWLMQTMPIEKDRFSKERQLAKLNVNS